MKNKKEIIEIFEIINAERLKLSKNVDDNSNIQEMILHAKCCLIQDILEDWSLV